MRADGLTYDRDAALQHLRACSDEISRLIDAVGAFTVQPDAGIEPFSYLLRSILYQQLHGKAAATIHGRVLDLLHQQATPDRLLDLDVPTLRTAGVSASKAAALLDLAAHAADGRLPTGGELPTLSDLDVVRRLTQIRGVGPWTVHMLLLAQLGRPDVLPTGDFGVREGYRLQHGRATQPTPAELRALAEPWRPYRSVASWYMWRAVDLHRDGVIASSAGA